MRILRDALSTIKAPDIVQLCDDQVAEGTQLELKRDLPCRAGRLDPWHTGGSIGEHARNAIAEEVVAFANTLGGVVLVGIEETTDHPKRAATHRLLPRIHELARRLRQAVFEIVDPPLPLLEAEGIDMGGGQGVVVIRVASSRRKPHRHTVNKEVFIRRADESVRIGMREIQELTIRSIAEATRIDDTIKQYRRNVRDFPKVHDTGELHFIGVPTTSFDLGRVVGRSEILPSKPFIRVHFRGATHNCAWLFAERLSWKPTLRAVAATFREADREAEYLLQTDGRCQLDMKYGFTKYLPGFYAGWLAAGLGFMLNWIDAVRRGANDVQVEYALAPQIVSNRADAILGEYGISDLSQSSDARIPEGVHDLPIISVGGAEEFARHLDRFDEDIWNLARTDRDWTVKFDIGK
jgi:Putative DNA-binding domain